MSHHKRRRPKNRRPGCLLCKPQKANGIKGNLHAQTRQEQKAIATEGEQIDELGLEAVTEEEFEEAVREGQRLQEQLYEEFREVTTLTAEDWNMRLG